MDNPRTQPDERIMKIEHSVELDKSGQAHLQRTDYSVEFLSPYITQLSLDLMENKLEELQKHLFSNVVEGLMHRALVRGMKLPEVFSPHRIVAKTLALIGEAESFQVDTATTDISQQRPLYLQPKIETFAGAVSAIVVGETTLSLIQTSLNDIHTGNFGMILRIISRLAIAANVQVDSLWQLIYCIVGSTLRPGVKLVTQAQKILGELRKLTAEAYSGGALPCAIDSRHPCCS
ncbi:hypothetical protein DXG03_002070 [Asterophora parasitica]|uniref:Uncharacterized protein n=1 Tax=Asterophora parasitica TaxID=117018 RepID=A0A9P7K6A7_9AGAR|nr:hypothetical protein DXG03_002070 [Asterophora parasitica]